MEVINLQKTIENDTRDKLQETHTPMLVRQLSPNRRSRKATAATPKLEETSLILSLDTLKEIDVKLGTIMRAQFPVKEFVPKKEKLRLRQRAILDQSGTWSS